MAKQQRFPWPAICANFNFATPTRQVSGGFGRRSLLSCALAAVVLIVAQVSFASTSRRIVADPFTGLAIDGFDPVSYFVGEQPVKGLRRFELDWSGATWRFANAGNRAAFLHAPDVYAPMFGGHGALAIARGYATQGRSRIWAVYQDRLFLFFSPTHRAAWATAPDRYVNDGKAKWPQIKDRLPR